jgi:hypothetical protein
MQFIYRHGLAIFCLLAIMAAVAAAGGPHVVGVGPTWVGDADSDLDMGSSSIICDDADASNDTKIVCDTDDEISIEINGAEDFRFGANVFTVRPGSSVDFDDDTYIYWGASHRYETGYDSAATQWEVNSDDCDGAGANCTPISIDDGTDDVDLTGDLNVAGQYDNAIFTVTCAAATDDIDINWGLGNIAYVNLDTSCDQDAITVNAPTNPVNTASYSIVINTGTTGTRDLTWNAVFLWSNGGTPPTTTQTASIYEVTTCLYVNSVYVCSAAQNIQ